MPNQAVFIKEWSKITFRWPYSIRNTGCNRQYANLSYVKHTSSYPRFHSNHRHLVCTLSRRPLRRSCHRERIWRRVRNPPSLSAALSAPGSLANGSLRSLLIDKEKMTLEYKILNSRALCSSIIIFESYDLRIFGLSLQVFFYHFENAKQLKYKRTLLLRCIYTILNRMVLTVWNICA